MAQTIDRSDETVCLVDDDPGVLRSIGRLMTSDGLAVRGFGSPREFLVYAQANAVLLVVLDIWMAEMNGLDVQATLAELSPATRVIVITGREDSPTKSKALQLGAVAFFTKPFDHEQFLAAVHAALRGFASKQS